MKKIVFYVLILVILTFIIPAFFTKVAAKGQSFVGEKFDAKEDEQGQLDNQNQEQRDNVNQDKNQEQTNDIGQENQEKTDVENQNISQKLLLNIDLTTYDYKS